MDKDIYCCKVFYQKTKNAGEKDIAFIPKQVDGDMYFVMQYRNLGPEDKEGKLSIIQSAIKFCPYCGMNLSEIISAHADIISQLAEKHKKFVLGI